MFGRSPQNKLVIKKKRTSSESDTYNPTLSGVRQDAAEETPQGDNQQIHGT
jgi:hypothetical protein